MKIRAALLAGTVAATGLVAVAAAPVAEAAPGSCAYGHACVYKNNWFGGTQYSATNSASSIGSMSDQGSSLGNSRDYTSRFYQNTGYSGWNVCISKQNSDGDLPNDRNDEISSIYLASPYTPYC